MREKKVWPIYKRKAIILTDLSVTTYSRRQWSNSFKFWWEIIVYQNLYTQRNCCLTRLEGQGETRRGCMCWHHTSLVNWPTWFYTQVLPNYEGTKNAHLMWTFQLTQNNKRYLILSIKSFNFDDKKMKSTALTITKKSY